jgi:hypothetical protein
MRDTGFLLRATSGRSAVRWSRAIAGTPKAGTIASEADGWEVGCSWADVPTPPLPPPGRETGRDLGLESFATLAHGTRSFTPGW